MSASKEIRLTERYCPRQFEDKKKLPDCSVCMQHYVLTQCAKKGKGVCKRKQTTYYCAMCPGNPAMCVLFLVLRIITQKKNINNPVSVPGRKFRKTDVHFSTFLCFSRMNNRKFLYFNVIIYFNKMYHLNCIYLKIQIRGLAR
ncbi:hypothetical protein mRhiFer1_009068 [Rhinolophus ferrumequinum]|uniref:Uncharacterized protein n=1 Tax=Rhinolophus ferrumequinum TaxID=59479 RepID=A0A7J7SYK4_RHIFE|nr:hypothetical protein mRhiFer1_009068 [Rhinolophus ferrumequinum]